MGILDYFTPEARRGNREWLNSQNAAISEALRYYLGPTGIPERLGLLAESTPTAGLERAGAESSRMFEPGLSGAQRVEALGNMLSETAGAGAGLLGMPAAGRVTDDLVEAAAPAVRQFGGDEFGGFTLYQGSPHNFAAERLVRMPDGSTQYIVGAPDVLPDVPAGAEVLQDFPLGRQRMDKIGTGEGAQAFGYGLYGAEAEDVAKGYRNALSKNAFDLAKFDGTPVAELPEKTRRKINYNFGGFASIEDALKSQRDAVSRYLDEAGGDVNDPIYQEELAQLKWAESTAEKLSLPKGSMYELDINADPEKFLDWDRPISEQPQILSLLGMPPIRSYATIFEEADSLMKAGDASVGRKNGWMENPEISARVNDLKKELNQTPSDMSVQNLLMQIGSDVPNPQGFNADRAMVAASDKLREAGVPGIRYLDAGSRSTGGTRNYVIFDENLINIVRKYGIAGAAAMLGMSQADVAQAMGQQPQGLLESGPQ